MSTELLSWPPPRGTVLVRFKPAHSVEVGIVAGHAPNIAKLSELTNAIEVVGGWLEDGVASTSAGCFDLTEERLRRSWRLATMEEGVLIREAYINHARAWDHRRRRRTSHAWVAEAYPPGRRSHPFKDGDVVVDKGFSFRGCLGVVIGMEVVWEHGARSGPVSAMVDLIRPHKPSLHVDVPPGATGWRVWNREQAVVAALRRAGLSPKWRARHQRRATPKRGRR